MTFRVAISSISAATRLNVRAEGEGDGDVSVARAALEGAARPARAAQIARSGALREVRAWEECGANQEQGREARSIDDLQRGK
jgi:hypothetical protein